MVGAPKPFVWSLVASSFVLNALRHQWLGHLACWVVEIALQVCAQRLTASMVGAQTILALIHSAYPRCSTPYGINGWGTNGFAKPRKIIGVLNALRHQWLGHWKIQVPILYISKCSTPYGINGWGTSGLKFFGSSTTRAQRLTASMVGAPLNI